METESKNEEFLTEFSDLPVIKWANVFTMDLLEKFKPHIVNFAKKCENENIYDIDIYENHTVKIYDHVYNENIIVILKKGIEVDQLHNKPRQYTEEELKALNECVEGLYD